MDAFDGDACAQLVKACLGHRAVDTHTVTTQPASGWQFQLSFDFPVVCQQQQPFRVDIKTTNRHDARHGFGQCAKHGRAVFFIAFRGHQTGGLVINPDAGFFGCADAFAVDNDFVFGCHVQRRRCDRLAVDRYAAFFNHCLGDAAACDACAGQYFGDTVAFLGVICHV